MKKVRVVRMQRRSDGLKHDVEVEIVMEKVGRSQKVSRKTHEKIRETILTPDWDVVITFDREIKESTK